MKLKKLTITVPQDLYDEASRRLAKTGSTVEDLVRITLRAHASASRVYGLEDEITFGKYRGEKIGVLIRTVPRYIAWLLRETNTMSLTKEAGEELLDVLDAEEDPEPELADPWGKS